MHKHSSFKSEWLILIAILIVLIATVAVSQNFSADLIPSDPVTAAKCQLMDLSKDGRVNASDESMMRNFTHDVEKINMCGLRLPSMPPLDAASIAQCKLMDISGDGKVNVTDEALMRNFMLDSNNLKACTTLALRSMSSSSSSSVCSVSSTNLTTDMTTQIDTRIAGLAASATTKNVFTTRGDATNPWVRNQSIWSARGSKALDLTGASPWNSDLGYKKAGTLISPRHIVFAKHYTIANGSTILFVDNANAVVSRKLVNQQAILGTDIVVGVLDADVPSTIAYYPIMSYADMVKYLAVPSSTVLSKYIPLLTLDQDDHAIVRELFSVDPQMMGHTAPMGGQNRLTFNEELITGDSGNPGFLVINNQLALILTHTSTAAGPTYGSYITQINQAMTALGGNYQVTPVNLSCYTN